MIKSFVEKNFGEKYLKCKNRAKNLNYIFSSKIPYRYRFLLQNSFSLKMFNFAKNLQNTKKNVREMFAFFRESFLSLETLIHMRSVNLNTSYHKF